MDLKKQLSQILIQGELTEQELLQKYTTFHTGGPARFMVTPASEEELCQIILLCQESKIPYLVLGRGSNLLVSDHGFDGVVLRLSGHFSTFSFDQNVLHANAGANLMQVAREAAERGLSGLAFAGGIPGSIGGAVVMNAGAYDGEIKDLILGARILDPKTGMVRYYNKEELHLDYRHSIFHEEELVLLSADFLLFKGENPQKTREEELGRIEEYNRRRREKQPLAFPSAGSTFKRPLGAFAGKLIQDAGLAGYRVGGAQVSEKHCGFVINKENATSQEIYRLCQDVIKKVKETSGYDLELEVVLVGEFSQNR